LSADATVHDEELATIIAAGAADLAIPLGAGQVAALVAYLRLVQRWSATYNLTSVRDPRAMATQHVVDCLAASAALQRRRPPEERRRILDVGSGAGLPGLVFAVAMPDVRVLCVDTVGKKTAFITQADAHIGARNASAWQGRVELLAGETFDVLSSRAFAALPVFFESTRHLVADNGEWLAMKGKIPTDEIAALSGCIAAVERVAVPGLTASRCIVWLRALVSAGSPRYI